MGEDGPNNGRFGAFGFWKDILNDTLKAASQRPGKPHPKRNAPAPDDATLPEESTQPEQTAPDDATLPETSTPPEHTAPSFRATVQIHDAPAPPHPPKPLTLPADPAPAPEPSSELPLRPGALLLDTYRLESDSIEGGMGAVWRVHHTGWDVDLAMKRPKPDCFVTEGQKRDFTRECERWIQLGLHPNIVTCYYVRELGGVPTIFSEWMSGGSVEQRIRDESLYDGTKAQVRARLLDIAIQFARGLRYAHDNELVHQDVKPDNLLLGEDWEAKVSDFGLAQARGRLTGPAGGTTLHDADPNATVVTPSGGKTPAYCSPEQAAGLPLTRRTDLYSWAVSVMELYLGSKPWAHPGQLTGPLAGIACRDYFPHARVPLPEALRELLARCMEQEEGDRPRDFRAVEPVLLDLYRQETGQDYPRPAPKAAADTADSRNNRALSYIDLGMEQDAVALWDSILMSDPNHVDTRFNRELWRVKSGACYDFEAVAALDSYPAMRRTGLSGAFRCCYTPDEPMPRPFVVGGSRRTDGLYLYSAFRQADSVHFMAGNYLHTLPDAVEGRFSLSGRGEDAVLRRLKGDLAAEVGGKSEVCGLIPCRDGRHAVVLASRVYGSLQSILLYDLEEERFVHVRKTVPTITVQRALLCEDDGLLALCGSNDTFLLFSLPKLTLLRKGTCVFLGFLPDGRLLLREKVTARKEALFAGAEDGTREELFRFERVLDRACEYCGSEGVFLAYRYKSGDGACFRLDEQYRAVPLRASLFPKLDTILFYEAKSGLLVTGGKRHYVWNIHTQECLYTTQSLYWHDTALYDPHRRRLLSWKRGEITVWQPIPLPPAPLRRRLPEWRLSKIVPARERLAETDRLTELVRDFDRARDRADVGEMVRLHRACLEIPGFAGSETALAMEDRLDPMAEKDTLRGVRCVGQEEQKPETLDAGALVPCGGGLWAAYEPDRPQNGVRLLRPDGTPVTVLTLPETARWVAVRGERVLVFGRELDVVCLDLTGAPLDPAHPAPAMAEERDYNNPLKYGFPTLLRVDGGGEGILYAWETPFDTHRKRQRQGVFHRNLVTGETFFVAQCYESDLQPDYLTDGTVLIPPMEVERTTRHPELTLRRLRPDGRELDPIRLEEDTYTKSMRFLLRLSPRRDRFLVSYSKGAEDRNLVYDADANLICRWNGALWDAVFLPDGSLCYRGSSELCIRSCRTNQELYRQPSGLTTLLRPDGRELWHGSKTFARLCLEYDYRA